MITGLGGGTGAHGFPVGIASSCNKIFLIELLINNDESNYDKRVEEKIIIMNQIIIKGLK